ncbi:MAG: response regulator transcription factor [Deferrisomatales bacterium]|nr:response regulator transcription factor [Deferrisomatales bacterium]
MSQTEILLVEDEPHIARGLVFNLEQEGYRVVHAETGEEALRLLPEHPFALVVLDLMLPGIGGLEVCRRIRTLEPRLPVLMLTALSSEADRVEGLRHGADDYLTKPFSLAEFLLRVQGMLRRSGWYRQPVDVAERYRFGDNRVDLASGAAAGPRGDVTLTELELKMLRLFVAREGEVLPRAELLGSVWGMPPDSETRTLDNFVVRLRKYFEPDPSSPVHFLTVRGRGYRFVREGGS